MAILKKVKLKQDYIGLGKKKGDIMRMTDAEIEAYGDNVEVVKNTPSQQAQNPMPSLADKK